MKERPRDVQARNWPELARRANYSSSGLAMLSGLSVRQLQRCFKQMLFQSPKRWLERMRLRAALKLLDQGASIKEVAYSLGYKRPEHFSRAFRGFFGIPPSVIRRQS